MVVKVVRRVKKQVQPVSKPAAPVAVTKPAASMARVVKKTVAAAKPAAKPVKLVQRKLELKTDELSQARQQKTVDLLRDNARGYRLSFGGLPTQRKLSHGQLQQVNKETVRNADRVLKQSRKLFDKHPATTAVNSAKNEVLELFHSLTLPFPDDGVRILVLKTEHLDFDKQPIEEIEKDFGRQIDEFSKAINDKLQDYHAAVRDLQARWPDVLQAQKDAFEAANLTSLFVLEDYPQANQLSDILYARFSPHNIAPPREYQHVSPAERQRVLRQIENQFQRAIEMQADFVVQALHSAIDQLIESVTKYHNKEQRSFKNSVVERVFEAFREFKEKTVKYGILQGDALEAEFRRAERFMREGLATSEELPNMLRHSGEKREDLIQKMELVRASIDKLAEARPRRSVIRD